MLLYYLSYTVLNVNIILYSLKITCLLPVFLQNVYL